MGIDLIIDQSGIYSAVQCKYKTAVGLKKMGISWKILSTFYSLCMRSGPWDKYIVMTNCNFVRHVGKKTEKDVSIILSSFQKISKEEWIKICNVTGNCVNTKTIEDTIILSKESELQNIRDKRLAFFTK